MPINFGTDSPLAVQNLPSSFAPNGVPIGWYNARRKLLVKLATSYLGDANSAVAVMSSQGVADTSDPNVQKTREGFNELRVRLPVLNQYYNYTAAHGGIPDTEALAKVKSIVLSWASINQPTGKPIDETNFENLIRVIGNRWGNFSGAEQSTITTWLNALKTAKESWAFNPATGEGKLQYGNHYTHHYKILLQVYQRLGLTTAYNNLITTLTSFAAVNFPFGNAAVTKPAKFSIIGVNQGTKTFTIAGDQTASFFNTWINKVYVQGGANEGWYTLVSDTFSGGNTQVVVQETIPSATVSGFLFGSYNNTTHDMTREADSSGESIDMIRRDALHYHQYDLEPWLEIAILSGSFGTVVDNAFTFLSNWILSPTRKRYEFYATSDTFDDIRWQASRSEYLHPRAMYQPDDAARCIFAYDYYKKIASPSFQVNDRLLAAANRSNKIESSWYYYFRWVFQGLYG
jgi:hypothetical protein